MDEQDLAKRFGRDVDELLRGGTPAVQSDAPAAYQRAIAAARALAALDLSAESMTRQRLRARLLGQSQQQRLWPGRAAHMLVRALPLVLSLIVLAAALLMMTPALPAAPPTQIALTATAPALSTAGTAGTPRASAQPGTPAAPTPPRYVRNNDALLSGIAPATAGVTVLSAPRGP